MLRGQLKFLLRFKLLEKVCNHRKAHHIYLLLCEQMGWRGDVGTVQTLDERCMGTSVKSSSTFLFDPTFCSVFFLLLLLINFWLHWVFVVLQELSLLSVSRVYSSLWCRGFSLWWLLITEHRL